MNKGHYTCGDASLLQTQHGVRWHYTRTDTLFCQRVLKISLVVILPFLHPHEGSHQGIKIYDDSYTIFTVVLLEFPVFIWKTQHTGPGLFLQIWSIHIVWLIISVLIPFALHLFQFLTPRLSSWACAIPGGELVKLVAVSFQVTRAVWKAPVLPLLNQPPVCSLSLFSWSVVPTKTSEALMKSRIHSFILSNVSLRAGATLKTLRATGREDLGP